MKERIGEGREAPSGEGASLPSPNPIPPTPKTFDWWGGRAAGVPLDLGQRKPRIACRYKEVLWTE